MKGSSQMRGFVKLGQFSLLLTKHWKRVFKRPSWTCQEIVGNLGTPKLARGKVQAAKVDKWPRIQKKAIAIVWEENSKC